MNWERSRTTWRAYAWIWLGLPILAAVAAHGQTLSNISETQPNAEPTFSGGLTTLSVVYAGILCEVEADCDDGQVCTTDTCVSQSCDNSAIAGCVACAPGYNCPSLDVVFIMDTSGSMRDDAALLCDSLASLQDRMTSLAVETRLTFLGITETATSSFPCLTDNVVSMVGDQVPCAADTSPLSEFEFSFESWGPATSIVAEHFPWIEGSQRIVIPISDEGPSSGNLPDGCNDPGDDRDSITNAIEVALRNRAIVSPILTSGANLCVFTLASDLALATGGGVISTANLTGEELADAVVSQFLNLCLVDDRCDDGDACTCGDVCVAGRCEGTEIGECKRCNASGVCGDSNLCTIDECIGFECVSTPGYDTALFICDPATGELTPIEQIDDDNPCTELVLDPCTGEAMLVPVLDRTPCEDGLYCTEGDYCFAGVCVGGIEPCCLHLDDQCVLGVCDEEQDSCVASPIRENEPCDDGSVCHVGETCVSGVCGGGSEPTCDDTGNECTAVACDPLGAEGNCDVLVSINENGSCQDGDACTTLDTCIAGVCVGGPELDCRDTNLCTDDTCVPTSGCLNINNNLPCDDDDACTEDDVCFRSVCAGEPIFCEDNNSCTNDSCSPQLGCVYENNTDPCDDEDACTDGDQCAEGFCVSGPALECDDGNDCTDDDCDPANGCDYVNNTAPCDDGEGCTVSDACDGTGQCVGTDINAISCTSDDDCFDAACDFDTALCICTDTPKLCLKAAPSKLSGNGCYETNELVTVNVELGFSTSLISGGQLLLSYDPTVFEFISIMPGAEDDPSSPFTHPLLGPTVDADAGTVFYVVGIDPILGSSTNGPALMATMILRAATPCGSSDAICFSDSSSATTLLIGSEGQEVPFIPCCAGELLIHGDPPAITCPGDANVNADAGRLTALVTWDPPTVSSDCGGILDINCTGENDQGLNVSGLDLSGGYLPPGLSTFQCTATDSCGLSNACEWSVYVSPLNEFELTVELSPTMAPGPLQRCIEFELFSNCVEASYVFEETLTFGNPLNFPGQAKSVFLKIPAGKYACMTARDPLHTLRSAIFPEIVDNRYVAEFRGDPFFGGAWLRGGNLNGDRVVDIVDFAEYTAQFGLQLDPDTPCDAVGPHSDINGDGIVDALDLSFIDRHSFEHDKDVCCSGGTGSATAPAVVEISVGELARRGRGDLIQADLNGDGWVNHADIVALRQGLRPASAKPPRRINRGAFRR